MEKALKENLTSQAQTITTILVKLLVKNDLELSVDRKGSLYFKSKTSGLEAKVTAGQINDLYKLHLKIHENNKEE